MTRMPAFVRSIPIHDGNVLVTDVDQTFSYGVVLVNADQTFTGIPFDPDGNELASQESRTLHDARMAVVRAHLGACDATRRD
jgi:hypothetical protein